MKILNLVQGSKEWLEVREGYFCASEAASMMNTSPYMTRNQLLHQKKTGEREEVSENKQFIFDKGHKTEAMARPIIEKLISDDLFPVVGVEIIDGLPLLSSFDGLTMLQDTSFEHKLWNKNLVAYIDEYDDLPDSHWPQVEHQLLLAPDCVCKFTVSDGTEENGRILAYRSRPERRKAIIDGWRQFSIDLESYEPEAPKIEVVGTEADNFPIITYRVDGTDLISNIKDVLPVFKERAKKEISRVLESDQDFADKDKLNKATKTARDDLKKLVADARNEFISFSEFSTVAEQIDGVLQKMQSQGEKQVKDEKVKRKSTICTNAQAELNDHFQECCKDLRGFQMPALNYNFEEAGKGKKTMESYKSAVDAELAKVKIECTNVSKKMMDNLKIYDESAKGYEFLFGDFHEYILQDAEFVRLKIMEKISVHKNAEELKAKNEKINAEIKSLREIHENIVYQENENKLDALARSYTEIANIALNPADFGNRLPEAERALAYSVKNVEEYLFAEEARIKQEKIEEEARLLAEENSKNELDEPVNDLSIDIDKVIKEHAEISDESGKDSADQAPLFDSQSLVVDRENNPADLIQYLHELKKMALEVPAVPQNFSNVAISLRKQIDDLANEYLERLEN